MIAYYPCKVQGRMVKMLILNVFAAIFKYRLFHKHCTLINLLNLLFSLRPLTDKTRTSLIELFLRRNFRIRFSSRGLFVTVRDQLQ